MLWNGPTYNEQKVGGTGVDTPETVMITRAPMVLKMWQNVNIQLQNDMTGN